MKDEQSTNNENSTNAVLVRAKKTTVSGNRTGKRLFYSRVNGLTGNGAIAEFLKEQPHNCYLLFVKLNDGYEGSFFEYIDLHSVFLQLEDDIFVLGLLEGNTMKRFLTDMLCSLHLEEFRYELSLPESFDEYFDIVFESVYYIKLK